MTTSRDVYEANWNRQTDEKDHVLSQADALTKKLKMRTKKIFSIIFIMLILFLRVFTDATRRA